MWYHIAYWPRDDDIIRRLASLLVAYTGKDGNEHVHKEQANEVTESDMRKRYDMTNDDREIAGEWFVATNIEDEEVDKKAEMESDVCDIIAETEAENDSEALDDTKVDVNEERKKIDEMISKEEEDLCNLEKRIGELLKENDAAQISESKEKEKTEAERAFLSAWTSFKENAIGDANESLSDISITRKDISLEEDDDAQ